MGSSRSLLDEVPPSLEESCCCRDEREDFLSGTFGFLLPLVGDKGPGKKAEGKEEVGVSDWLE